ncbi:hypothetical protein CEXT_165291 [Caerostris extrusa]|uniref:Uncharacterized protein n=1 Tax=Caerostris extrusa TaxID=172846 RepID=A0AAV4T5D5_CAEEX|nr:hypothetical protein CEXT_165291 [Caerostris extrusa]
MGIPSKMAQDVPILHRGREIERDGSRLIRLLEERAALLTRGQEVAGDEARPSSGESDLSELPLREDVSTKP